MVVKGGGYISSIQHSELVRESGEDFVHPNRNRLLIKVPRDHGYQLQKTMITIRYPRPNVIQQIVVMHNMRGRGCVTGPITVAKLAALMASTVLTTSVSAAHTFPRKSTMTAAALLDEVIDKAVF